MIKHTPGPWMLGDENNESCEVEAGETTISLTRHARYREGMAIDREEMIANAYLIIAAPELLAACEDASKALHDHWHDRPRLGFESVCAKLEAAIAKAKGNSVKSTPLPEGMGLAILSQKLLKERDELLAENKKLKDIIAKAKETLQGMT